MAQRRKAEFETITFNDLIARHKLREAVHSTLMLPLISGALLAEKIAKKLPPWSERHNASKNTPQP